MSQLRIDPLLLEAVIRGTAEGLQMTGLSPQPVGASRFFAASRPISVIVGLVGENNGTVTLNMGERAMMHLAGRLMGEERKDLCDEVFDAIGEIGNMVAGNVKDLLEGTPYATEHISVPSVILGENYTVYYMRGITAVSVEFELDGLPATHPRERFFTSTISLLRPMG